MRFRQFVNTKSEGSGRGRGDTIYYDKVKNIVTTGGTLTETSTMPSSNFTIVKGTMSITEYGNSIPYTGKLEALAEFDVNNVVTRTLRNDMARVLDAAAGAQFVASDLKYVCYGTATYNYQTAGTASATAGASDGHGNLNEYHVKNIVDMLKKYNISTWDGENYICIASIEAIRGLKDDSNWVNAQLYNQRKTLFNGEVGTYYGCRFVEETNYLDNTIGHSSYGEAVFFGADAVSEAPAIPEEIRAKIPTDYGRSRGVAWYALTGFKKIWDYEDDTEEHIIHVTSA